MWLDLVRVRRRGLGLDMVGGRTEGQEDSQVGGHEWRQVKKAATVFILKEWGRHSRGGSGGLSGQRVRFEISVGQEW